MLTSEQYAELKALAEGHKLRWPTMRRYFLRNKLITPRPHQITEAGRAELAAYVPGQAPVKCRLPVKPQFRNQP